MHELRMFASMRVKSTKKVIVERERERIRNKTFEKVVTNFFDRKLQCAAMSPSGLNELAPKRRVAAFPTDRGDDRAGWDSKRWQKAGNCQVVLSERKFR